MLGDDGRCVGQAARIGADQEVGVVFGGQARVKLLDAVGVRLVVIKDGIEFQDRAVGQGDAAGLVDLIHPQVQAVDLAGRFDIVAAGLRSGEADGNRLFGGGHLFLFCSGRFRFGLHFLLRGDVGRRRFGNHFGLVAATGDQHQGQDDKQGEQQGEFASHVFPPTLLNQQTGNADRQSPLIGARDAQLEQERRAMNIIRRL